MKNYLPLIFLFLVGVASAYPYATIPMFNATATNGTISNVLIYGNTVSNGWYGGLIAVSLWFLIFFISEYMDKSKAGIIASTIVLIVGVIGNMAGAFIPQQVILIDLTILILLIVIDSFN